MTRHPKRLGLHPRRFLDPNGEINRKPGKIVAHWPGHMVRLDVKKVGSISDGGGGASTAATARKPRQQAERKSTGANSGYLYLHSVVDGFSRLVYTEPLPDEKGAMLPRFSHVRRRGQQRTAAATSTAWSLTTAPVTDQPPSPVSSTTRLGTEDQALHTASQPQSRALSADLIEEPLYTREFSRDTVRVNAIAVWNIHYDYHRPHSAADGQPPATRLWSRVSNVQPSYDQV